MRAWAILVESTVLPASISSPDHAGDDQFPDLEIDTHFLLALDHEIAVRQNLRDDGGDIGQDLLVTADRARTPARGSRGCPDKRTGIGTGSTSSNLACQAPGNPRRRDFSPFSRLRRLELSILARSATRTRTVRISRDLPCALTLKSARLPVPKREFAFAQIGLRYRHRQLNRLVASNGGRVFDRGKAAGFANAREPSLTLAQAPSGASKAIRARRFRNGEEVMASPRCAQAALGFSLASTMMRPGPAMTPLTIRFDCRFCTPMADTLDAALQGLPRVASVMPGISTIK